MRTQDLYRIPPPTMQRVLIGAGWRRIVLFALAAPAIVTVAWTILALILSQAP